ncbi:hypothetical protein CLI64_27635 [Nostoc sp. CENA543]|uniref:hypothetical protein n=1 Tax=Nostoc sp. CENA543 TaxID=1869241 RepID=UPI000CA3AE81|nr:hypothetical protein [Nostoc sp. CENA543]AUT03860.1 hypothetical protein CLI64_27635 [Nostoc sp. CENA543]
MKKNLKRAFLPSFMAASLASLTLLPAQPAAADRRIVEDTLVGAGAGAVTGLLTGCNVVRNAAKGAAAGAAVNGANGLRNNPRRRNVGQDIAVGAGASTLTGVVVGGRGRCNKPLNNAVNGAAAGTAVHIWRNNRPRR